MDLIAANDQMWKFLGGEELGVTFGWAIICKDENGEDYFDLHGDHIPEESMLKAALEFALSPRLGKVMHAGKQVGTHAFIMPITTDMVEANKWASKQTGLLIGWHVEDDATRKMIKDGKLAGFSIGGAYGETEELPDD